MVVTPEVTAKLESLSSDDYNMVVMLINRLADKPSNVLKSAREKYLRNNSMTMDEIDDEIESYRSEKRG